MRGSYLIGASLGELPDRDTAPDASPAPVKREPSPVLLAIGRAYLMAAAEDHETERQLEGALEYRCAVEDFEPEDVLSHESLRDVVVG